MLRVIFMRKLILIAPMVCLCVLAGCIASPVPPPTETTETSSAALVTATGVDYSTAPGGLPPPSSMPHAVATAGSPGPYKFAVRYLSGGYAKDITLTEAKSLWANGIDIVSNWEGCGGDPRCGNSTVFGFANGVSDARTANAEVANAGAPPDRPIYFSIDFDTQNTYPDPMPQIRAYFEGVASVIGLARTGAYGSYFTIKDLFDNGKITWGWQTVAWLYSNDGWDSRAQLRQVGFNDWVDGVNCDLDHAQAVDFGQWHASASPTTPQCVNNPGTGNNCGDESVISGGNAKTLYHCAGYGPATVVEVCPNGCTHLPPGTDDVCTPGGAADAGADVRSVIADSGTPGPGPGGGADSGTPGPGPGDGTSDGAPAGDGAQAGTGVSGGCAVTRERAPAELPWTGAAAGIALAAAVARRRRRVV